MPKGSCAPRSTVTSRATHIADYGAHAPRGRRLSGAVIGRTNPRRTRREET